MLSSEYGTRVWSLISIGVALNVSLGILAAAFKLPLYLDSVGTVLVAALAGVGPAFVTATLGVCLVALASPTALAFLPVAWLFSLWWGGASRLGVFRYPLAVSILALASGVLTALAAAPIAVVLFGGVTGGGTDLVVALLRANGQSAMEASFQQGLMVDPLDKLVTCLSVLLILKSLPFRALAVFKFRTDTERSGQRPLYRPKAPSQRSLSESRGERKSAGATQLYSPGDSAWHRGSISAKFLALALSILALLQLDGGRLLLAIALLIFFNLVVAPEILWPALKLCSRFVLAIAIPLVLIQGLLSPQEDQVWRFLGLSWSIHGLDQAGSLLLRLTGVLLQLQMFLLSTPLHRLAEALGRARVPYPLIFVLLEGVNLVPRIRRRVEQIEELQLSRGTQPYSGWNPVEITKSLKQTVLPVVGGLFAELPTRASALQSRGFLCSTKRTPIPLTWFDEKPTSLAASFAVVGPSLLFLGFWLWP